MTRYGAQFGPNITFLGIPAIDVDDAKALAAADVVIVGAPFDGGTSYRAGARFGPSAIRGTDYLPHDGSRPSLAMRTDGLKELNVVDMGDVEMFSGDAKTACESLEKVIEKISNANAIPIVLGGDHTITWPDVTGVAKARGWGKVGVIHFDAHADTGDITFGSLIGHGHPMRQLIESGACRGDRSIQIGLRGYWPDAETLKWMSDQKMRSYEMTEITARGFEICLDEAIKLAMTDCDAIFLSVDVDVVDPGSAPGTGTPEPGGLSSRQVLDAVRKICYEVPIVGMDIVEVAPGYDHADITVMLANRIVLEAISALSRKAIDAKSGQTWNPSQPLLEGR